MFDPATQADGVSCNDRHTVQGTEHGRAYLAAGRDWVVSSRYVARSPHQRNTLGANLASIDTFM
jgi:hypothetical protein